MIIAQISDSHIEAPGKLTYGEFDATASLVGVVDALNELDPQPDLVLHTGDLVHSGKPEQYEPLRQILRRLDAPLSAIPGNHDSRDAMRAAFRDATWMPTDDEFLHYTIENLPVRVICLDTVIPGETPGMLCPKRLSWLRARLTEQPDRPTIIAGHHPAFDTAMTGTRTIGFVEGGPELADILASARQVVRVIAGHSHRPMLFEMSGRMAYVAPATCYQFECGLSAANTLALTREPPGYALHIWLNDPVFGPSLVTHTVPVGDFGAPVVFIRNGENVGPAAGVSGSGG